MANTTEGVRASKNKKVIQEFKYEDFALICDELGIAEEAIRELLRLAQMTEDDRLKADIYKWFTEMNIGRPGQRVDLTSKGESLSAGIFIEGLDDDNEEV
jgi:hypothetical protein